MGARSATPAEPSEPQSAGSAARANTPHGSKRRRPPSARAPEATTRVHGAVPRGHRKEVGDAGEHHEQLGGEAAQHLGGGLPREQRSDQERHAQTGGAEVHRAQRARGEAEDQPEHAGEVQEHRGLYYHHLVAAAVRYDGARTPTGRTARPPRRIVPISAGPPRRWCKTREALTAYSVRSMQRIRVIDSHTGGEPTRIVIEGGPDLGDGTLAERRDRLRGEHERFRTAVVGEPRGSQPLVGGILCPPREKDSAAAVIFFDNAGMLGMCGHGTIGLLATLAHLGRIGPGRHRVETPVGVVTATLHEDRRVTVVNVPSYRRSGGIVVEVPGDGVLSGRRRVGRQLVLPGAKARAAGRAGERLRPDGVHRRREALAGPGRRDRRRRGRGGPRGAVRPVRHAGRAAGTSSSARAGRTTARPVAPARAPSWPVSTPRARCGRASRGGRRASPAASSRPRTSWTGRPGDPAHDRGGRS